MLLYTALTSVVLEATRLDHPRDRSAMRVAEPVPVMSARRPAAPAIPAQLPALTPARLFGRLLVEE